MGEKSAMLIGHYCRIELGEIGNFHQAAINDSNFRYLNDMN